MATNFLDDEDDDIRFDASPIAGSTSAPTAVVDAPDLSDTPTPSVESAEIDAPIESPITPVEASSAASDALQKTQSPQIIASESRIVTTDELPSLMAPATNGPVDESQSAPSASPASPDISGILEERDWLMENPYQPVHHQRSTNPQEEAWLQREGRRRQENSRRERLGRLKEIDRQLEASYKQQGIEYGPDEQGKVQPLYHEDGSVRYKPGVISKLEIDPETNQPMRTIRDDRGNIHRLNLLEEGELGKDYKREEKDLKRLGEYYVETERGRHYLGRRDIDYVNQRNYQAIRDLAQADHSIDAITLSETRSRMRYLKSEHGSGWDFGGTIEDRNAELQSEVNAAMEQKKNAGEGSLFGLIPASESTRQFRTQNADEDLARLKRQQEALQAKTEYDELAIQERALTEQINQRKMVLALAARDATARKYINLPNGDAILRAYDMRFRPEDTEQEEGRRPVVSSAVLLDKADALAEKTGRSVQETLPQVVYAARQQGLEVGEIEGYEKPLYRKKGDGSIAWGQGDPVAAIMQAKQNGDISPEKYTELIRQLAPKGPPKDSGVNHAADAFWRTAIHTSNIVNQSLAGLSRFVGADDLANHFAGEAAVGTEELQSATPVATNRKFDDSWTSVAAEIGGNVIGTAPAMAAAGPLGAAGGIARAGTLLPRLASLTPMALQAASSAYEGAWQEAKAAGKSDEEADSAGNAGIIRTLPNLALYAVAGAATDRLMRPLTRVMPILETPFARAAGAAAIDLPLNIAADAAVMAAHGENPLEMRAADIGTNIAFSFLPAMQHWQVAKYLPTARAMADGSHPEIQSLRALTADRTLDPALRREAFDQAIRFQNEGKRFISELGVSPVGVDAMHLEAANRLRDLEASPDTPQTRDERAKAAADANRALSEIVHSAPEATRGILRELVDPNRARDVMDILRGDSAESSNAAILSEIGRHAIDSGAVIPSQVEALRKSLANVPENRREAILRHAVGAAVFGDSYNAILKGDALREVNLGYLKSLQESGALVVDPETGATRLNAQYLFLLPKGYREKIANTPELFDRIDAPDNLQDIKRIIIEGHTGLEPKIPVNLPDLGRAEMPSERPGEGSGLNVRRDAAGNVSDAKLQIAPDATPEQLAALRAEVEGGNLPEATRAEMLRMIEERVARTDAEAVAPASDRTGEAAPKPSRPAVTVMTSEMVNKLKDRGYTPTLINAMDPGAAAAILSKPAPATSNDRRPQVEELRATSDRGGGEASTPENLKGEKLNEEWTAYAESSGSLGIPRAEMPQIKAEARGALTQFLKAMGIIHAEQNVLPGDLKPTQAEYSQSKVDKARKFTGGDRAILVSSDGHVVDGHHQWMARLTDAPDKPIRVIRLYAPIRHLLDYIAEFPSAKTDSGATRAQPSPERLGGKSSEVDDLDFVVYSRSKGEPKKYTKAQAEKIAADATARFKNLPEIEIVQSYDDLPISTKMRDRYRNAGVNGYYRNGKVTIIADKMESPSHIVRTALHEIVGHHGFRGAFGDNFQRVADELTSRSGGKVAEIAKRLGLDLREPAQRREAAEEFIAEVAEGRHAPKLRDGFINWLGSMLQKAFPSLKIDRSYVQELVRDARAFVREGTRAADSTGDTRFARAQVGMKLRDVGPDFVRDDVEPRLLDIRTNNAEIAKNAAAIFQRWPQRIAAADGSDILLYNKEGNSIGSRVRHLIFNHSNNTVNAEKAMWMPMVPETLQNAAVRLIDQESGYRVYVREYRDGNKHMVIVRPDGEVTAQRAFKGSLITQFKDNPSSRRLDFEIDWVRPETGPGRSQGNPRPTPDGSTRPDARQPEFREQDTRARSNNQPENKSGETRFSRGERVSEEGNPYRDSSGRLVIPERASSKSDPTLKNVEERMRSIADDPAKADAAYNAIPDSKGGKVIGTDIARELLPEYADREGKIAYTNATGRVGQAYAKDRLWREIENRGDRETLMFTAGGVAAGKSTAVSDRAVALKDLVFDGTLRETNWAIKTIEQALKNGWKVELNYVQRPMDQVIQGVIDRTEKSGRWGPLSGLPKTHQEAQGSAIEIAKHFEGNPNMVAKFWLNENGEAPKRLSLDQIDRGGEYSYNDKYESTALDRRGDSGVGQGVSGRVRGEPQEAVERIFREAVESGRYDQRILDLLAKGNERLERIARGEQVEPLPKASEGDIRFSRGEPEPDELFSRPPGEESSLTPEEQLLHGAVVESGPKGWRRLFYGAADILEGTKGAEHIGRAIRNQVDRARELQGIITSFHRKLAEKEGKRRFREIEEKEVTPYYAELDRDPAVAAKLYEHLSPEAKEHIEVWRAATEWSARQAKRLGVKTKDADGTWRDMGEIDNFHPRTVKPEYMEAMLEPKRFKKRFQEIVEEMKKAGMASNEEEVIAMFHKAGLYDDNIRGDHFASMERARVLKLPHKLYDYSFNARQRYMLRVPERLSQVEFYGQRTDTQQDIFEKAAGLVIDKRTGEYINAVGDAALGIRKNSMLNRSMALLNSVATGTMLGNPMSATLNLVSGSAYNFATTGFRNNLRALMEFPHYAKRAAAYAEARDKGVLLDDLMDLQADTDASGSSLAQKVNKATGIALKVGGFNIAEDIVRVTGYVASKHWLRDILGERLKNPSSRAVQNAERFLKNISVDADKLYKEGGQGPETDRFYRAVNNAAQGGYRIDQTPVYMNTPLGKFLTKYQKWGSQASRHAAKTVINPLLGKDGPVDGMPLFRYLVATGVAGGILSQIREGVFGSTDTESSFDEIVKTWNENERRAVGLAISKVIKAQMLAGAGGMVANYAQQAWDVFDRSRAKNPLDPPGLAVVKNAGDQFLNLLEQGTLTPKDLNDYLRAQLSFYRTSAGMAGRAGLFPIEKARQDRSWLAAQTRRFADEVGIEAKRTQIGRMGRTEKSPIIRDITDALMTGDTIGAKEAMQRYLRQGENHEQRELLKRSLKQSIKSRQPLRVGSAGEQRREDFLKWAQRRLSAEDLQRAKEIDAIYRRTAERVGLM